MPDDESIRVAVFRWLREQMQLWQDVLPIGTLRRGFMLDGHVMSLIGPRGIWIPRQLDGVPISITTTWKGPYDDQLADDGLLVYRFQGNDPTSRDNRAMRTAMERRLPLVYFRAVTTGWYLPVFPVFVARQDVAQLAFHVAVDPAYGLSGGEHATGVDEDPIDSPIGIKRYIHSLVKARIHQSRFRVQVLAAYDVRCCLCRLAHRELLDAAHIIPDGEPDGDPVVPNGLSLCKIHHAAFDRNFIGISPDCEIEVNRELLDEIDGPMLKHGIQELNGSKLIEPGSRRNRPDRDRLARRYEEFRWAG